MLLRSSVGLLVAMTVAASAPAAIGGKFNKKLNIGDAAPTWSDLPGIDDKPHGLSDLQGAKCVVVGFFSHECHVSKGYASRIAEQIEALRERGVEFVLIDCLEAKDNSLAEIAEFARENKLDCAYVRDASQQTAHDYGATHTPAFFVLDDERKIAYMGAFDDDPREAANVRHRYVSEAIDAVLAKEKPRVAETRLRGCPIEFRERKE